MKRYSLDRNGLYWELKDEDTCQVLVRSSSKQAAILKAMALGRETGGRLNIFKKSGEWESSRNFERARGIKAHEKSGTEGGA